MKFSLQPYEITPVSSQNFLGLKQKRKNKKVSGPFLFPYLCLPLVFTCVVPFSQFLMQTVNDQAYHSSPFQFIPSLVGFQIKSLFQNDRYCGFDCKEFGIPTLILNQTLDLAPLTQRITFKPSFSLSPSSLLWHSSLFPPSSCSLMF